MARRPRPTPRTMTAAFVSVVALIAAACSDPPTSGGNGDVATGGQEGGGESETAALPDCPLDALDEASGPVEITLWYGGLAGTTKATMDGMAEAFNASQDKVVVRASDQGSSYEEVYRKYESAASASTEQLPDIVYLEQTQLQVLADSGGVLPAQACMEADGFDVTEILPAVRAAFEVDGVLYPAYANVSGTVLYYNKAHFARAGLDAEAPPETLDELAEVARALKDAGVSDKPFVLKASHTFLTNWLIGEGVDVVNEENGRAGLATEATFDTPEAVELMEFLRQMNDEGLLNVFSSTEGGIDHYLALVNQQSSMIIETSTATTTIRDALAGTITAADVGVDIDESGIDLEQLVPGTGQFPGVETSGQVSPGGGAFYMLNTSEPAEQAASWEFLKWMLQPEQAAEWHINGGYLPILKSLENEPAVQDFWANDVAGVLLQPAIEQLDDADPDRPGPLIGPYIDFVDATQQAMEAVLLDGQDPADALGGAQADVTESLERYAG
jgi:sn-glycerol 3-phosphate transport system substrate-binding protein